MSTPLSAPYQFDEKTNVWSRPGYDGIPYNDGDEIEQRLLDIVAASSDRSVLSPELRSHCTDWPSVYHLSGSRANILRPFEPEMKGRVLEIGAGCGAITRYLGECGAEVLALEGSVRRATIARCRTRDLANVTVLAERFSAFETDEKFDIVTLIGVLEYASMFVQGEAPDLAMLRRAKALLKPGGQLLIAIENQLGLKYFAGAPEDHVATVSFGLENRYQAGGARTYGRRAIDALLQASGFGSNRFFACFPDYKFPVSIVSEAGFETADFDAAALAVQSVKRDPQLPSVLAFRPERVWGPLVENRIALDLGNSFLISASGDSGHARATDASLAWHFSTERRASFCKITRFEKSRTRDIEVHASRARPFDSPRTAFDGLVNDIGSTTVYFRGQVLSARLSDMITRDGWDDEGLRTFILEFFAVLSRSTEQNIDLSRLFDEDIPGKYIDAIPQNFIRTESGAYQLIDTEWEWDKPISPAYLLFRGLHVLTLSLTKIGAHRARTIQTHEDFLRACFSIIGQPIDEPQLTAFYLAEQSMQNLATDQVGQEGRVHEAMTEFILNPFSAWEKIAHQTRTIETLVQKLAEQDMRHAHDQVVIADREKFIRTVITSRSWRLTKPLRFATRLASQLHPRAWLLPMAARLKRQLNHRFSPPARLCICIQACHPEMLRQTLERAGALHPPKQVLVIAATEKLDDVKAIARACPFGVKILAAESLGRDVFPFLEALNHASQRDLILSIQTPGSPDGANEETRQSDVLDELLVPETAERIFQAFGADPYLGMVASEGHLLPIEEGMGQHQAWFSRLKGKMPKSHLAKEERFFSNSTMFYARPAALWPLMALDQDDFQDEAGLTAGTLAHGPERLLGAAVGHAGFHVASSADPQSPASGGQAGDVPPLSPSSVP